MTRREHAGNLSHGVLHMTVPLSWMTYPAETGLDTGVHKSGSLELPEDTESTQNVTLSQSV